MSQGICTPSASRGSVALLAPRAPWQQPISAELLLDERIQMVWSQASLTRLDGDGDWQRMPGHRLVYLVSGEAVLETDAARQVLHAGDLLCLPPDCDHRLGRRRAGRAARAYLFHLRLARGGCSLRLFDAVRLYADLRRLGEQVGQLHEALCAGGLRGRCRARALIYLLLSTAADERSDAGEQRDRADEPGLNPAQRQAITTLMHAHPERLPSVAELAAQSGLSVDYFTRLFRRSFGMPPRQWLVERRIRRAADELRHATRPIAELARRFGYRSEHLFGRQFKAVMGVSPSGYRRAHGRVPA